jgi:UDP-glucose 4-epimerase
MKIIITGGNGFIGYHLFNKWSRHHDVKLFIGNFCNPDITQFRGIDVVVHLASIGTQTTNSVKDIEGSCVLFDCCYRAGVKKIIFPSSGGSVYGVVMGNDPIMESDSTNPISSYGVAKLAIEKYLYHYYCQYGMCYTILRISNPYGMHQSIHKGNGVILKWLTQIYQNEPIEIFGNGRAVRDYIHIDDVIDMFSKALEGISNGLTLNVGSGVGYCLDDIFGIIKSIVNHSISVKILPKRPVDLPYNVLDCGLAESVLGWKPKINIINGISTLWREICST